MSKRLTQSSGAINRRNFLTATAATGLAGLNGCTDQALGAADPDASQVTSGKDRRLTVHETDIPVLETPPELLGDQITPVDRLFVRNNQPLANASTLRPFPLRGWTITLSGLVDRQRRIDAETLSKMDQVDREMVLQCCGNGRSLFAQTVQAKGTQWTRGGMGNVRVTGVLLSTFLEKLGVRVGARARYLTAAGKDHALPGKDDFEHSLPLDEALQHSLLALNMNGRPIPAVHGGPLRL
ncbi:MAG: molybdopterin-dependent oxidoreductase, partial [Planctomycetaceae bacterium]